MIFKDLGKGGSWWGPLMYELLHVVTSYNGCGDLCILGYFNGDFIELLLISKVMFNCS